MSRVEREKQGRLETAEEIITGQEKAGLEERREKLGEKETDKEKREQLEREKMIAERREQKYK